MSNFRRFSRRTFISLISLFSLSAIIPKRWDKKSFIWQVGIGKRKVTPTTPVWLAGYGRKRVPYGKIHDLYVKVLALKDSFGKIAVLATTDNQGMSKTVYEAVFQRVYKRFGIDRTLC